MTTSDNPFVATTPEFWDGSREQPNHFIEEELQRIVSRDLCHERFHTACVAVSHVALTRVAHIRSTYHVQCDLINEHFPLVKCSIIIWPLESAHAACFH